MLINNKKYDEIHTDSLANCKSFHDKFKKIYLFYKKMHERAGNVGSIAVFKQVFGKQQCCKNYTCRNWIWTFSEEGNTIWCLVSKEGINWEYDSRSNQRACLKLMDKVMLDILEFSF